MVSMANHDQCFYCNLESQSSGGHDFCYSMQAPSVLKWQTCTCGGPVQTLALDINNALVASQCNDLPSIQLRFHQQECSIRNYTQCNIPRPIETAVSAK